MKCNRCGSKISFISEFEFTDKGKKVCRSCYEQYYKEKKDEKEKDKEQSVQDEEKKIEQINHLSIPGIEGLGVAVFGILLLVATFIISLSLGLPKLNELEGYYNTIKALYICQFLGLVITFSGLVIMIQSFYTSWKDSINKLYEKLK